MHKYTLGWRQAALSSAVVLDSERCRTHLSPLLYTSYNSHPAASDGLHASPKEFEYSGIRIPL